jgi:hypothetical protein
MPRRRKDCPAKLRSPNEAALARRPVARHGRIARLPLTSKARSRQRRSSSISTRCGGGGSSCASWADEKSPARESGVSVCRWYGMGPPVRGAWTSPRATGEPADLTGSARVGFCVRRPTEAAGPAAADERHRSGTSARRSSPKGVPSDPKLPDDRSGANGSDRLGWSHQFVVPPSVLQCRGHRRQACLSIRSRTGGCAERAR